MFCIEIVPIGSVDKDDLRLLCRELSKEINVECRIGHAIFLPEEAYDPVRGQYNGETLLRHLILNYKSECILLGIVDKDLYVEHLNFIFGISQIKGKACIVALPRLREEFYGRYVNKSLFIERMVKESIHEIGHVLGMNHCENRACVMSFSNSILEVDMKTRKFCKKHEYELLRFLKSQI